MENQEMKPRKTVVVNGRELIITPRTTAADLKHQVGAAENETLTMWYKGTLYYWCGHEHIYPNLLDGDTLKFGDLSGHPAAAGR